MELDFDALCATAADSWASCSYPTLPDAHPGVIGAGARRKGKKRLNLDEVLDQTVKLPRLSTGKRLRAWLLGAHALGVPRRRLIALAAFCRQARGFGEA